MAWVILFIGSLCEVGWLIALKYTEGFTRLPSTLVTVAFMGASVGCLGLAVKSIPMGTAYAAWTGTSIAVATVFGIYLFDEPTTVIRLASIGLTSWALSDCDSTCDHHAGMSHSSHARIALKNSSPTSRAALCRASRSGKTRQMQRSAGTRRGSAQTPIFPPHASCPYDVDQR